jgi:hypothetical protein
VNLGGIQDPQITALQHPSLTEPRYLPVRTDEGVVVLELKVV